MSEKLMRRFYHGSLTLAFNNKLKNILLDISSSYNIDSAKLINKYCNNNINAGDSAISIKKEKRKKNRIFKEKMNYVAKKRTVINVRDAEKTITNFAVSISIILEIGRIDDDEKYKDTSKYIKTIHEKISGTDYLD